MNSAPHLLIEDRPEFERLLDDILRNAHHRTELAAIGRRLNTEQLRTLALGSAAHIAACAAQEYQRFVQLREELRRTTAMGSLPAGDLSDEHHRGAAAGAGFRSVGGAAEAAGAGVVAILAVLTPVLAGIAAVIFLLVGYALHILSPEPSVAEPMRQAGWIFAALTAAGILTASAGLLLTALRNGSGAGRPGRGPDATLAEEVAHARAEWRTALLEQGIVPFLSDALADSAGVGSAPSSSRPRRPENGNRSSRLPRPGYSRPEFSGPDFSSPGFSSRDHGTHAPGSPEEASTRPRIFRPDFSQPDFSSPDYGGPERAPE